VSVLSYIQEYREQGFNLVPLKFRDKVPAVKWDEYQQRLITDEEIKEYWNGEIRHNVGIVCGQISGNLTVIDFDTVEAFEKFFGRDNHSIYAVRTGRGVHVYYRTKRPVKTLKVLNSNGQEEITLKGEGSYVVAPPSVHPSGVQYEIMNKILPIPQRDEEDFREFFRELAEKKGYKVQGQRETIDIEEILKGVKEGNRDNSLLYLLTFLRRAKIKKDKALELAKKWNQRNQPPLAASDVEYKVDWVYNHEPYKYRFTLNPKTVTINDDLEIKEIRISPGDISVSGIRRTEEQGRLPISGEIIDIPGEDDYVVVGEEGVQYVFVKRNGDKEKETPKTVIRGLFRINKRYDIDGFTYFDVSTERRLKVLSMDSLLKLLKSEGKVLKSSMLSDVVSVIASNVKEVERGYSAIGIYEREGGELEVCLSPIPITDEQQIVQLELKDAINYKAKAEDIERYITYMGFFHPHEMLPVLGTVVMSPFSQIIKQLHIILPIIYLWGKHKNIGKSITVRTFTQGLYGLSMASADRLQSEFRFNEIMDSACLPRGFDEGEKLNFDKMVVIREACENPMISSRGKPDLTQVRYHSRLTPIFTGNDIKAKRPETLKRMFIIHFNEERTESEGYEKNSKRIRDLLKNLKPVGFELMQFSCQVIKTKENLYNLIRAITNRLTEIYKFEDITKSESWSVVYLGLLIWHKFCKKYGINWELPKPEEFAEKVIKRIEGSTWGEVEEAATAFRDWFDGWLERRTVYEEDKSGFSMKKIKGEGEIIKYGFVENSKGEKITGYWITNTVLQDYTRDAKMKDLPPISNLKRLAESVSQTFDIPIDMIADEDAGKRKTIGGKTRAATFIPVEDRIIEIQRGEEE